MNKVPCKICPKCQSVNKIEDDYCLCGSDLTYIRGELISKEELDMEDLEIIGEIKKVFIQKCRFCGMEHVTTENMSPVTQCYSCGGKMTGRVEYQEEDTVAKESCSQDKQQKDSVQIPATSTEREKTTGNYSPKGSYAHEEDDDDNDVINPFEAILANVKKSVALEKQNKPKPKESTIHATSSDDDDEVDWPDDVMPVSTNRKIKKFDLVLTCTTNKNISYTVECAEGKEYRIGRDHNMKEALAYDDRISHDHCHLVYHEGVWSVVDHSINGTFVSKKDIGQNGTCVIHEGDVLTLGHFADSIAFTITRKP